MSRTLANGFIVKTAGCLITVFKKPYNLLPTIAVKNITRRKKRLKSYRKTLLALTLPYI